MLANNTRHVIFTEADVPSYSVKDMKLRESFDCRQLVDKQGLLILTLSTYNQKKTTIVVGSPSIVTI